MHKAITSAKAVNNRKYTRYILSFFESEFNDKKE